MAQQPSRGASNANVPDEQTLQHERELLYRYAKAINKTVIETEADIPKGMTILPQMLPWCQQHDDVLVMTGGNILTFNPASRDINNCKATMLSMGITPGEIIPAARSVVTLMIANTLQSDKDEEEVELVTSETSQQQRLRMLIKEAIEQNASDIHLQVREQATTVRFRINGEMTVHATWSAKAGKEIASVAFNKETDQATAHFNPLIPQDASMPLDIDGKDVRLRLASVPAHGGFDMVMRILSTGIEDNLTLEQLGYTKEQIFIITRSMQMTHGAVLVAGPTGSGKTTTLASCLTMIKPDRKVYTIEDPVEKVVDNATQIPVNTEKSDRTFASMGRASLRMDPDVVVLGEMRDEDTAAVMVRASLTGHLVLSTIHTNSAPAIVTRLADLGISHVLLGDPNLLVCLMFQRLVVVVCPDCAIPILQSKDPKYADLIKRWTGIFKGDWNKVKVRGPGCAACHHTGVRGRKVVAEVIWVDEPGKELITKGEMIAWVNYLREHGWKTYQERAMDMVAEGLCDPLDAEKVVGELSAKFEEKSFTYGNFEQ